MQLKHVFTGVCLASVTNALALRQSSLSCYVQSRDPQPSDSTCGQTGTVVTAAPLSESTAPKQAACRDLCYNNSACLSFSYDSSNQKCTQYSKSVADQVFVRISSTVSWSDKSCFERYCPPCPTEGQTNCDGTCVSLSSDSKNCGKCGTVCSSGSQICSVGKCIANPGGCGNQGLEWAKFPNTRENGVNNSNAEYKYPAFEPAVFKTRNPTFQGTTTYIGGFNSNQNAFIYGSNEQINSEYYTLSHRGYLFAPETGKYNLTIGDMDDIVCLWVGRYAYSGYTRANADKCVAINMPDSRSLWFDATAGTYTPIRIIFGQAQGGVLFKVTLTSPSGTVLLDSKTKGGNYILQESCDKDSAPAYADFGRET